MIEQTLVLVKPDGVKRGLVGEVIKRFERVGLKIVGMTMVQVDPDFSKKHYANNIDKPFYKILEKFIISGPVVAMVLEGVEAVEFVRKVVGFKEPKTAEIGTIRGDFAHTSFGHEDGKKRSIQNLVHASGTLEEAKQEIALWFSVDELHSYKLAHEGHVM